MIGIDIVLSSLASKLSSTALGLAEDSKVESFLYSKSGNIIASNLKVNNKESEFDVSKLMLSSEQKPWLMILLRC